MIRHKISVIDLHFPLYYQIKCCFTHSLDEIKHYCKYIMVPISKIGTVKQPKKEIHEDAQIDK